MKNFCEDLFFFFFFFFFGDRLKNFCEDLFFFFLESTCACVLGPWPRAFLSLASRVSVLGKAVLGLGLGFFLCPWPWPRALCPRLHLWCQCLINAFLCPHGQGGGGFSHCGHGGRGGQFFAILCGRLL